MKDYTRSSGWAQYNPKGPCKGGQVSQRRRCGDESKGQRERQSLKMLHTAVFEDGKGPQAKECRQFLEASTSRRHKALLTS